METGFYQKLIKESPLGYAYHKILCDEKGKPTDYEFIDINTAFENLTGLKARNVIGKKVSDVLPNLLRDSFDWISFYGEVALGGEEKEFDQYFEPLERHYNIRVFSPEPFCFVTVFSDITNQMRMINLSKQLMEHNGLSIDYQKICDDMLLLSGAKYAAFNLFDRNGRDFKTVGVSGVKSNIAKACSILGFELKGKLWKDDPIRRRLIEEQTVTYFKGLSDLSGYALPKGIPELLENLFGTGQTAIVRIAKDDRMLGDFTLFMRKGETLRPRGMHEIYAAEVGLFLEQKKLEQDVRFLNSHDHLTGLINRRFYEEQVDCIDNDRYYPITLMMVDVNGLKLTNDAFGHGTGDLLLQRIADILKQQCRDEDIVARIGGDEFVVLMPGTDAVHADIIIRRFNAAIAKEQINNISLSVSVGFAVKEDGSEEMNDVFRRAEDAMYRNKLSETPSIRCRTIDLILTSLFEKSEAEMSHSQRVGDFCEAMAIAMNFSKEDVNQMRIAGIMHDIGKIGVNDSTLNKPEKLQAKESMEIKRHSEIGYRILNSLNEFSRIAVYVLEHHERLDGKGYPKGLKGNEISLQAKIISVIDAYDAITSNRTYSKSSSTLYAISEIKRCCGTQFDPDIAKVFVEKVLGEKW